MAKYKTKKALRAELNDVKEKAIQEQRELLRDVLTILEAAGLTRYYTEHDFGGRVLNTRLLHSDAEVLRKQAEVDRLATRAQEARDALQTEGEKND